MDLGFAGLFIFNKVKNKEDCYYNTIHNDHIFVLGPVSNNGVLANDGLQ